MIAFSRRSHQLNMVVLTASTSTTNAIQDLHQALAEDHNENFQPPRSDNKKRFKTVSEEELREKTIHINKEEH